MNKNKIATTSLLTQFDIRNMVGKPVFKKVIPPQCSDSTPLEEWVYYLPDTNTEEHYFFKDIYLAKWEKVPHT